MTTSPAVAASGLPAPVADLLDVATREFVNLAYLSAGGSLALDLPPGSIRGLRLEVPAPGELHLRGLEIEADGIADVTAIARLSASSLAGDAGPVDMARLLSPDESRATVLRTGADGPAWVELRFSRPVDVRRVTLTNALAPDPKLARGLRVSVLGRFRRKTVYQRRAQMRAWRSRVADALSAAEHTGDPDAATLVHVIDLVVRGEYQRSDRQLRSKVADKGRQRLFMQAANAGLLRVRRLEWTIHGPSRSFRWWTEAQKVAYLGEALEIAEALRGLTTNVCLGFGSVLAVVRDGALIPHDNDLDMLVAFEPSEAVSIADGMQRLERFLPPLGYEVVGTNYSHRYVRRPGNRSVDVFAGQFEGDAVSWFPGPRHGLTREILFPPTTRELMGLPCPIPADPEAYLERVYGADWRVPDPQFKHARNMAEFADIAGSPTGPGPADSATDTSAAS